VNLVAFSHRVACNKAFYEHDAVAAWLFTQPHEQRHCALNKCFFLEAKAVRTFLEDGTTAKSPDMLLWEGQAQVMNRLAHLRGDRKGAAVNGSDITFLCINFTNDGDILFLCFITSMLTFHADDTAECPIGLRYLVRLIIEDRAEAFGLPASGGFSSSGITFTRRLGVGGFGVVNEVCDTADGTACALKSMRHTGVENKLEAEQLI
jgi:hypothetical protein